MRRVNRNVNPFIQTIVASDPVTRDRSFDELCRDMTFDNLLAACDELEQFRQGAENLYERVRATTFLYAAHRFCLQESPAMPPAGFVPYAGYEDLLNRRFEEALRRFRRAQREDGPSGPLSSALAEAYHELAFQTLADQVRRSVRASTGNQWMFRVGHPDEHPLRMRPELLARKSGSELFPILVETTPVRLDLSHSGWSDIFFLGMDYPEGARVLNISVNLGVYGRDAEMCPPIRCCVRAIPEPVLRLASLDLGASKDVTELRDLFNFGNDYLSLLKAGIIASGIVPPSFEGAPYALEHILARIIGPGMGLELVSEVNDIPKGSRLAVSTNLLAGMVSLLMRATGQTRSLEGQLDEGERRLAASRAILGEWLGGSGGGWQDSGGVWPGIKIIQGAVAAEGDPEWRISKGRLLPQHRLLGNSDLHPDLEERLTQSLVLIHGGMAQNVGPILEMVTEKYLLRSRREWDARQDMAGIFDAIVESLREGDVKRLAELTTRNFQEPLRTVIPWVTNHFTETLITRARATFGRDFWGFLMLGGMSGGGMAMFVAPEKQSVFKERIREIMMDTKRELEDALPFAMDPVVYDFSISKTGTVAQLSVQNDALMPARYFGLLAPELVRGPADGLEFMRRLEIDRFTRRYSDRPEGSDLLRRLVSNLFRIEHGGGHAEQDAWDAESRWIKESNGFDPVQHEQIRADLRQGRIGLAHNRLPVETDIRDVDDNDLMHLSGDDAALSRGKRAISDGRVAVLSLAAGVGTRWTTGAGVIKAVNPFVSMAGRHRSFLEIHLAKSQKVGRDFGAPVPHLVSTSFLTQVPVAKHLDLNDHYGYEGELLLSPGRAIGQRLVPMVRDLVYLWEEMPQEQLDEQKQKVRDNIRRSLMSWADNTGEGSDYTDNVPIQRFHPPGHWYEVPNLLRNGVLAKLLETHPQLETIMLHNIDTLGASVAPEALGLHLLSGNTLTFEVVPRRITDHGGGLARVNGRVRLLEGLAQPREEDEMRLRYYNSMTTWIQIDPLLEVFGLTRDDLKSPEPRVTEAVRHMAQRMPTYVTIKDVKKRWGHGQEDVYPVTQFEKLWSDMTGLTDVRSGFLAVSRLRGQQLKGPEELDPWANDGSKDFVESLCAFN